MATTKTMTTADLAAALDTDPRTLRKFLRSSASPVEAVGKGKRYSLPATKAALTDFGKKFNAWTASQEKARQERAEAVAAETTEGELEIDDTDSDALDDARADDAEPTDEELEEITAELDEN